MLVIKGNLVIKQVPEQRNKDIIAFADLDGIDISDAMVYYR